MAIGVNSLAVDLALSLFRLTVGDVSGADPHFDVLEVADRSKFCNKLVAMYNRAEKVIPRIFDFLGGRFIARGCNVGQVQDLARQVAHSVSPDVLVSNLNRLAMYRKPNYLYVEWGFPPYPPSAPPLLASVEFMEGARAWPASQYVARGSGSKAKVEGGYRREVRAGCTVLGALALAVSATYVYGSQREGLIRLFVPLSLVEYSTSVEDVRGETIRVLGGLRSCSPPEYLVRMLVMAALGKPALFRLVDVVYRGGIEVKKDSTRELIIDTSQPWRLLLALSALDARRFLVDLAARWCECDRRGWKDEKCKAVAVLADAARRLYIYAEGAPPAEAHMAKSEVLRLAGKAEEHIVNGLLDLADYLL